MLLPGNILAVIPLTFHRALSLDAILSASVRPKAAALAIKRSLSIERTVGMMNNSWGARVRLQICQELRFTWHAAHLFISPKYRDN